VPTRHTALPPSCHLLTGLPRLVIRTCALQQHLHMMHSCSTPVRICRYLVSRSPTTKLSGLSVLCCVLAIDSASADARFRSASMQNGPATDLYHSAERVNDVAFVARNLTGGVRHRAEQVAAMWPRATFLRSSCSLSSLCIAFPWACGPELARLGQGLLVVHVKFACYNLVDALPAARHVLDPSDQPCNNNSLVYSVDTFTGLVGYSEAKTARQRLLCGARQTWTIPMHSIAATGCAPLSPLALAATRGKLPIRHSAQPCKAGSHAALRVLVMGWEAVPKWHRQRWAAWARRWCSADQAEVKVVFEGDLLPPTIGTAEQTACPFDSSNFESDWEARVSGNGSYDSEGVGFIAAACNALHCFGHSIAVAVAYRELPPHRLHFDGVEKGAHRLISPLSVGIPAIGQRSHAAMLEFVKEAELGAGSGRSALIMNDSLVDSITEAIARTEALLRDSKLWLEAHSAALSTTVMLDAAALRARYNTMADAALNQRARGSKHDRDLAERMRAANQTMGNARPPHATKTAPNPQPASDGGCTDNGAWSEKVFCTSAPSTAPTSADPFNRDVRSFLTDEDRLAFTRATGNSVEQLLTDQRWNTSSMADLAAVMGTTKVVPHPLNALGLHALRALVAERVMRHVSRLRGAEEDAWHTALVKDGILRVDFDPNQLQHQARSMILPPALNLRLRRLLSVLSAPTSSQRNVLFGPWTSLASQPSEPQFYMHVDTFQPTYKVWIFANTTHAHGPFHYVRGSHHNDERKLRWLFERTRCITHELPAPQLPGDKTLGPYFDATHNFSSSMRVEGFDPRDENRTAKTSIGAPPLSFGRPEPILQGSGWATVVVADTSGFHYRGRSLPRMPRMQATMLQLQCKGCEGEVVQCGPGCLPRREPIYCAEHLQEC
jgi:hypothetical protein